jgi:hypothetical protein
MNKETEQMIVNLYTTKLPDGTWQGTTTIASLVGCSHATVQNVLKKNNVVMRDARQAHSGGKRCKPVKNIPDGNPPFCKCGCETPVAWNQRKNRWNAYVDGHYRQDALYKNADWLRVEYSEKHRTMDDIASECGVNLSTISKFMVRFNIPIRTQAESLTLSGAVRGPKNPAWKGGVAEWDYSYDWKAICKHIKDRDEWSCQSCGERRSRWGIHLHVHHIDGDKLNNSPDNLISLCARCHRNVHAGRISLYSHSGSK